MRWETLLAAIAIAVFALNSFASPYFLDPWALSDLTFTFTEKGLIALPMALLIISGEFDLSVAAIMALASTLMGMAAEAGAGMPLLVIIGVLIAHLRGWKRPARGLLSAAVHCGHHRHDEPLPRHRLHHSWRPGLWKISG
jgi:ribose/xylose/arabinose/galactoside ABC-type transport system permease subunit